MNIKHALLMLPLVAFGCSGSDDGADDTGIVPRDGGTVEAPRDGGTVEDGCPDLGPALTGAEIAPLRRGDMASAYDPTCGIVYMAFGDLGEPENCNFPPSIFIEDLHAFDVSAGTWHVLSTVSDDVPIARARSQGVWDTVNRRLVVFGGRFRQGTTGAYTFLNDVWAFDPVARTWTELSEQVGGGPNDPPPRDRPSGRMNFSLLTEPSGQTMILHGGGQTDFAEFQVDSQTWLFSFATNTWTLLETGAVPPARLFHSAAYDEMRDRMYIFAGAGRLAFTSFGDGDMWSLDLGTVSWSEVQQPPPPTPAMRYPDSRPRPRIKGKMISDPARDRLVLFGGHDDYELGNNNDLWAFDLATETWSIIDHGDGQGRTAAIATCSFYGNFAMVDPSVPERRESHLFVRAGADTAVLYGGRTDCGLANDTWTLDLTTDTWTQVTVSPTGMTCVRNGNPDCDDDSARMCD